jgi:phosphatidate cytidylyltransferase
VALASCGAGLRRRSPAGRLDRTRRSGLWWLALAVWVIGGALALRAGPSAWPRLPPRLRLALGLVALWAAWLALAMRARLGINFILSVLCVVWVADIAAYFGGRAFGRRKLAPAISPGKSWEGVYSGMVGVLLLALAWIALERRWWSAAGPASLRHAAVTHWGRGSRRLFCAGLS